MKLLLQRVTLVLAFAFLFVIPNLAEADFVSIVNASFEDTTGQTTFNEFTFGTPVGWNLYDPNGITPLAGVFTGTLQPNGVDFFNSLAPDGNLVAILFNSQQEGNGEYGFEQTLAETLQANTQYELSVEVGNIGSGTATNGQFFNLDEFPGYRVELLAGGTVLAQDQNLFSIPEREWGTSIVSFTTGDNHAQLGQSLGIRIVNENFIPAGYTQGTSPDLEVDFDNVRLSFNAIPEPTSGFPIALLAIGMLRARKR